MYKDFVKLLQTNEHLTDQQLKIKVNIYQFYNRKKNKYIFVKGEYYFENDILVEGGQKGVMSNETSYTEVITTTKKN